MSETNKKGYYTEKVNKEISKKHISCHMLYGLATDYDYISHCCVVNNLPDGTPGGMFGLQILTGSDAVRDLSPDIITREFVEVLIEKKNEIIYKLNNNIMCACTGCHYLEEIEHPLYNFDNFKFHFLRFADDNVCNVSCVYCPQDHAKRPQFQIMPILNKLHDLGYLDFDKLWQVNLEGGEPTIRKDFVDVHNIAMQAKTVYLPSSGAYYSPVVEEGLKKHNNYMITVSIDSGTRETYKKVKGVDQFDKVVNNVKNYYDNSKIKRNIRFKYIMLPENCSMHEIDSFFNDIIIKNKLDDIGILLDVDAFAKVVEPEIKLGVYYFMLRCRELMGHSAGIHNYVPYSELRGEVTIDYLRSKVQESVYEITLAKKALINQVSELTCKLNNNECHINEIEQELHNNNYSYERHISEIEQKLRSNNNLSASIKLANKLNKLAPTGSIRRDFAKAGYHFAKAFYKLIKKI